jgi:enoyl-CoA hydratase/carnithine racemase
VTGVVDDTILTADDGAVRTITLNRPQVRNAIDIPLRLALADALENAADDDRVAVVVLTGAGTAFCSGGDISTMQRTPEAQAMERAQLAQRVIRAIWTTSKPVLAAVEGSAFGAGTALAAACDRVIAARNARFATTFLNVGLAGDMGTYASLPARVGIARTRQMLLTGQRVSAADAHAWGLVDALADPGSALSAAMADAQIPAAKPAGALAVMKQMLAAGPTLSALQVLNLEAAWQSQLFDTDDFAEGIAAFHAKRAPVFGHRPTRQGARS